MRLLRNTKTTFLSVKIIPIQSFGEFFNLTPDGKAIIRGSFCFIKFHCTIEKVNASVVSIVLMNTFWNKVEILDNIWEAGHDIICPVSGTVADNETFQIDRHRIVVTRPNLGELIILVNLPGQVRRVNATITLT